MVEAPENIDRGEIAKFDALAARWWNREGEFKPLHDINPLRLDYIARRARLVGKKVLDVGCGGGILAEAMAGVGATVTGVDLGEATLAAARRHAEASGLTLDYRAVSAEDLATAEPQSFDIVTCMELLEHVPDPAAVVAACTALVKPQGHVFFSTINRNPKSFLFAIAGAEYLLGMLPKGTHEYARLIRPAELGGWARTAGLHVQNITGITYNPVTRHYRQGRDVTVNYILHAVKT